MAEKAVWVEIIEPETRKLMYANITTGDCHWEEPKNVQVKRCDGNAWWQLVDPRNNRHYYFNASTNVTKWSKPVGADIIPLVKIQEAQALKAARRKSQTSQVVSPSQESARSISPLSIPHADNVLSSQQVQHHGLEPREESSKKQESQPQSFLQEIANDTVVDSHSHSRENAVSHTIVPASAPPTNSSVVLAEVESNHEKHLSLSPTLEAEALKRNLDHSLTLTTSTVNSPSRSVVPVRSTSNPASAVSAVANVRAAIAAKPNIVPQEDIPNKLSQQRSSPAMIQAPTASTSTSTPAMSTAPVAPPLPPALPVSVSRFDASATVGLATESGIKNDLNTHTTGLFRKKVSIATMLAWSKESLHKPMLLTHNKKDKKDAIDIFRNVLIYMGDKTNKSHISQDDLALEIVSKCWSSKGLRDEIFIQLCKQTTQNQLQSSCVKGWELMWICLNFFPPSFKFLTYIQGYISRHTTTTTTNISEVSKYAIQCGRKLDRVTQSGGRKGQQAPSLQEIVVARGNIFSTSSFGSSLEEIMQHQVENGIELRIPKILKDLTDCILRLNGHQIEGIFRIPGDLDAVNLLINHLDRDEAIDYEKDANVPSSALKLWFRELGDPLIPKSIYDKAVDSHGAPEDSVAIVDHLPEPNRTVLLFVVRFLQLVGQPENQEFTKMTPDNLALVWAPNFLRCPSNDPMIIFQNAKKEMFFVRNLILNLNTEEVAELL